MKFEFAHDRTWPHPSYHKGPVFGCHYVCGISGCTYYLDLIPELKDWFDEMAISYELQGLDPWREGYSGKPFELDIPNDAHALIFKLRWL